MSFSIQVCELDIIFNFEKAYFMLDELLLGGEIQETSKKNILKAIAAQDLLQEVSCILQGMQYVFVIVVNFSSSDFVQLILFALICCCYM